MVAARQGGSDMKLGMNIAAVVFLLVGLVWTLQGANYIAGSFMTGQPLWLYIGLAVSILAIFALY
jgi:hypothetical protein